MSTLATRCIGAPALPTMSTVRHTPALVLLGSPELRAVALVVNGPIPIRTVPRASLEALVARLVTSGAVERSAMCGEGS